MNRQKRDWWSVICNKTKKMEKTKKNDPRVCVLESPCLGRLLSKSMKMNKKPRETKVKEDEADDQDESAAVKLEKN